MAPFDIALSVAAQSAQVFSFDRESILVEAGLHAPLRWFLDQTKATSTVQKRGRRPPSGARANKRQKIKHIKDEPESQGIEESPIGRRVLLGRASITIDFGGDVFDEQAQSPTAPDTSFPVRLVSVGQQGENLELCLARVWDDSPILVLQTDSLEAADVALLQALIRPQSCDALTSHLECSLHSSTDNRNSIQLTAAVSWSDGDHARSASDEQVLSACFPTLTPWTSSEHTAWNPRDFYDSVYTPPKTGPIELSPDIEAHLYPFQQRTVQWMLNREGTQVTADGKVCDDVTRQVPFSMHHEVQDASGGRIYYDPVREVVSSLAPADVTACSGGILAEEMGLGKTVELVALITAHPQLDLHSSPHRLAASRATLIISPASILQQWKLELQHHAPALKVYHYEGMSINSKSKRGSTAHKRLIDQMSNEYDIVLTTYQTLTREVHFAVEPPERDMRRPRAYERPKCPLVEIEWWRICLDEAQMLETGVTAAARVACQLPRIHSWAISGTPVKRNVEDLRALLLFLRIEPFASNQQLWRVFLSKHPETARRFFNTIALRHTKAQVRDDIRLPPQKRVVLNMPFTTVENQQYLNVFKEMCTAIGVNTDGSPASGEWDPEDSATISAMRTWLGRLRRTCLHPQVDSRGKRLGRNTGPLRTVDEVLDAMIEQNETLYRTEERAAIQAQLLSGHVQGNARADQSRSVRALQVYELAMARSRDMVEEARDRLRAAQSALRLKESITGSDNESSSDEAESALGRHRTALRAALQLLHTCIYFAASAKYQIKTNTELTKADTDAFKRLDEEENALYDQAKAIRQEILNDASHKAVRAMRQIKRLRDNDELTTTPSFEDLDRFGGIACRNIVEKSYDIFDTIRTISKTLITWRAKMLDLLTMQLVDAEATDNELKGDEYEQSTKHQDELYVYFDAFKALQADLVRCINGDVAPLIDNEARGLLRAAKRWLDPEVMIDLKTQVHAPELTVELFEFRQKLRSKMNDLDSVRGLIAEARRLQDSALNGASAEASLAAIIVSKLQPIATKYNKAIISFEKEVDIFRTAQNLRLEYYRQLQAVSDDVEPYKDELDEVLNERALENAIDDELRHSSQVAQLRTKQRFLNHLKHESGSNDSARICVICQTSFDNGVLTVCGHQYCKECIQEWWRSHRSCPVCKRSLALVDFHNITYKPRELKAQEENQHDQTSFGPVPASGSDTGGQTSIYSEVDNKLMDQIKAYDLSRSYGTKIDTLARHLLWIREHDPGAKSIVFSQYREFLDVLSTAFNEFKIGHTRLGQPGAVERFRIEASKDCLLLDAKTDSSGLTLVNATHVFICEPLVQTAVELQAIARVHRIGQNRPTTVWMYLVNDTIEESIYAISKARRIAQVQSKLAAGSAHVSGTSTPLNIGDQAIDKANSDELQNVQLSKLLESGKSSGELVDKNDLWQCLFGNAQKVVDATRPQLQAEVERNVRAHAAEQRARMQK